MSFLTPTPLFPTLGSPLSVALTRANLMTDLVTANGADAYFMTPADYSKWKSVVIVLRSSVGKQLKTIIFDGQSDSNADLSLSSGARETVWNVESATVYDFDGGSIAIKSHLDPSLLNIYDFDLTPATILESETDSGAGLIANQASVTSYYAQWLTHSSTINVSQFDMYAKSKDGGTSTLTGGYVMKLYDSVGSLIATSDEFLDLSTVDTVNPQYISFTFPTSPQITGGEIYEFRGEYTGVHAVDWGSQDGNLSIYGFNNTGSPSEFWAIGTNLLLQAYNSTFNMWGS